MISPMGLRFVLLLCVALAGHLALAANSVVVWGENNTGQTNVPLGLSGVVAISAGESHNLALKDDGTVAAWGYNYFGQATVAGLSNIAAIAAGADHSLALRTDGRVVAWGGNSYGQTNIPAGLSNVVAIAAGGFHSLALRGEGTVTAWGENEDGQSKVPLGLTNVVAVAGGWRHSLALRVDGTVIAWGDNNAEQTTIPPGLSNVVAIAAGGFQCLAIKADGTVIGWGNEMVVPSDLTNIVAVAVGADQSLALQADGTVVSWGNGITLPVLTNVVAIAAGGSHNLALIGSEVPFVMAQPQDRAIYSGKTSLFLVSATRVWPLNCQWQFNGSDLPGQTNALLIVTNAQVSDAGGYSFRVSNTFGSITSRIANFTVVNAGPAIVVAPTNQATFPGGSLTFAIQADGSHPLFYQWRFGEDDLPGATNSLLTLSGVNSNTVGRYAVTVTNAYGTVTSTGALLSLNPIVAWGDNRFGQTSVPWGLSNVVALAGGEAQSMALRADGTVAIWGLNDSRRTNLPSGLSEVIAIAAGEYQSLALRADGTVAAWGFGHTNVPPDLSNVVAIAAGSDHSLALRSDGTVTAWGSNHDPWFGNYAGQATVPEGLSNVVAVAAGTIHSLALRSDGTVVGWGNVTVPSGLSNIVVIAAGAYHSLAIQADGAVLAWYNNGVRQDVPSSLTNVVAIAGGFSHSLALHSHGTVTAWDDSDNYFDQSSVPPGLANVMMIAAGGYLSLALVGEEFHTDGSPSVTTPLAQTNYSGESVFLMARASGVPPLIYQWLRNGNAIPGATNSFLSLKQISSSDGGIYSLMVSNRVGVTISHGAPVILIDIPPSITLQPADASAYWNGSASLEVQAQGSTPLSYQWRFDGIELTGATNATLLLDNLKFAQAGRYSVVVSNAYGTVTSSNAVLRLVPVVVWGDQTAVPTRLSNVVAIAAGGSRTLALQSNGVVVAWDESGELADIPAAASNVTAIAAGGGHNLALRADGTVVGWGYNGSGQTTVPANLSNVVAIAAGMAHSLALRADGVVIAWGYNEYGQTNVPAGLDNVVAIAAGSTHTLALRSDGTVVTWGDNVHRIPEVPSGLTNVVAIAAGGEHNLALKSDGIVVGWSVSFEQSMVVPAGLSNVVAIAASGEAVFSEAHSLALRADGTVVVWGQSQDEHTLPSGLSNIVAIATGRGHSVALVSDRLPVVLLQPRSQTIYAGRPVTFNATAVGALPIYYQWQWNGSPIPGQTNSSLVLGNVQFGDAGAYSLLVSNAFGTATSRAAVLTVIDGPPVIRIQPADFVTLVGGTATLHIEVNGSPPLAYQWRLEGVELAGATNAMLVLGGLKENQAGRYSVVISNGFGVVVSSNAIVAAVPVVAWGDDHYGLTNVPAGLADVMAIAAGETHILALKRDGTVVGWGDNQYGQTDVPVALSNAAAIAAGGTHGLALKSDGTVVAWGNNSAGQRNVPSGLSNVVAVSAGHYHSLALLEDGTMVVWGRYGNIPATVPIGLRDVVAIASGGNHSLALRANGEVVAWGEHPESGPTHVPVGLTDVVAIAARGFSSMALKADGTVVAWGTANVLPGLSNVVAMAAVDYRSLVLLADGTMVALGTRGLYGESDVPSGLSNIVAVAASGYVSLGLIGDGRPAFTLQPVRRTAFLGGSVTLQARTAGLAPISYQWRRDGADVAGATNFSLVLTNLQFGDDGHYSLIASNVMGVTASSPTRLKVIGGPPVILIQPSDAAGILNGSATLSVEADGSSPLSYQWRFEGMPLLGKTNPVLVLERLTPSQAGRYSTVISNALGTITTREASLAVSPVVSWGAQAQSTVPTRLRAATAIAAGGSHSLALQPDGALVAWGFGCCGWAFLDQTTVPSSLTNVAAIAAGENHTLALRSNGTVVAWGLNNVGQAAVPSGLNNVVAIAASTDHSMALKANGTVVAWGYSFSAATSVPLNVSNIVAIAAGAYYSLALRSDGTVVQWPDPFPTVTSGLSNVVAIAAGGYHNLALRIDGTVIAWGNDGGFGEMNVPSGLSNVVAVAAGAYHSLALQGDGTVVAWGNNYEGQATVPFGLNNVAAIAAGASHALALIGDGTPLLTTQPASRVLVGGDNEELSVMVVGQVPLSYQWQFNGTNIVGATNHVLALPNVQPGHAGAYSVIVSNALGVVTSRVAQVQVVVPARVAALPASTTVLLGSNVTLFVEADGTPPLRYQWRKNGENIPGATNSSFTITNVQVSDGGAYTVVVKNDYGTATTDPMLLIVEVPPEAPGDDFAQRVTITNIVGVIGGTNRFATKEAGEPNHGGKRGGKSVWYTWQAPTNGIATFRTRGSVFDTLLGIYTGATVSNLTTIASDEDRGGFFTSEVPFNVLAGTNYHIAVDGFAGAEGEFILSWELEITSETLPVITNQPQSQAVLAGSDVMFSVVAVGDGLTYQWFFNDSIVPGATTPTLTRNNVQPVDVGSYFVRVRNSVGREVESLATALELVNQPRPISQDKLEDLSPEGPGGLIGPKPPKGTASFTVSLGTVDYQIVNNRNSRTEPLEPNPCGVIGGKSQAILLRATSNGMFRIDTIGSTIDTVLTVYRYTNYLYLTNAQVACDNDGAPDGRTSLLWFNATANTDYLVIVDGVNYEGGTIQINWAFGLPPSAGTNSLQPRHTFLAGQSLTLRAPATNGIPPLHFQWHWNGVPIPGATNALFTLNNLQSAHVGFYTVTASNALGSVTYSTDISMEVTSMRAELDLTDKVLRLWLPTATNQTTIVETSTDLQHWAPVYFYSPQQNNYFDFSITNSAQQFFRTRTITGP